MRLVVISPMSTLALAPILVFLCAPSARAAGETFTLRWVEARYCPDVEPWRAVRSGYVSISSDTEWDMCTDLFICALGMNTTVSGTTTRISRHRAVFVGSAPANLVWTGPVTIQAELELGSGGVVRGTFIAPAVEGAYCAARGRFRTTERTD